MVIDYIHIYIYSTCNHFGYVRAIERMPSSYRVCWCIHGELLHILVLEHRYSDIASGPLCENSVPSSIIQGLGVGI